MDSLTQVALGAAVGHAAAGHTLGRRALLLGGIAGTLPDLDILAYPFLDPAGELRFHRGLTHGLLFAFWAGPLFGALAWRFARWRGLPEAAGAGTWTPYAAVFFWGFLTHAPLDAFTVYGTQLLAPFLNTPYAVSSVFIIDPLVTVPLLIGLAVALWAGSRPVGRKAVAVALAVMTVYLGWSVGAQAQARSTVEAAYAARGVVPERMLIGAGPLTTLWWRGIAAHGGQVEAFSVHLLDPPEAVEFGPAMQPADLPPALAESRTGQTLDWFSRGWLVRVPDAASGPGEVVVADPRFGRVGQGEDAPFVFSWTIEEAPPFAFEQRSVEGVSADVFGEILSRIRFRNPASGAGTTDGRP